MTAAEFLTVGEKNDFLYPFCVNRWVMKMKYSIYFFATTAEAQLGNQEFTFVQLKTGVWLKRGLQALHESQAEFVAKLVHQ
jgi:hypothetical protein